MKILRLWIITLMVAALLCGCSSNKSQTNEVLESDVLAETSDITAENSDISLSDGNITSSTLEVTTSEPTQTAQESTATPTIPSSETPQKTNSQAGTAKSSTESTKKPAESSQPTKTPEKPASSQPPAKTDPPKETPKSAFAKPFDISTMKSELIAYGSSIGMTHITNMPEDWGGGQITPDGTTWLSPVETWHYESSSADKLKQDICGYIKRWKDNGESTYTLWFEKDSTHSGNYIIYVIIG